MSSNTFKYESCSVQVKLPEDYIAEIQEWSRKHISDDILYLDPLDGSYGRDLHSHVTVCLGLNEGDLEKYSGLAKDLAASSLSTKAVIVWETDLFDLVCLSLLPSDELLQLNAELTQIADKNYARRKFTPHVSIAFVKKGIGRRLIGKLPWAEKNVIENRQWIASEIELVNRRGEFIPLFNTAVI